MKADSYVMNIGLVILVVSLVTGLITQPDSPTNIVWLTLAGAFIGVGILIQIYFYFFNKKDQS
ncbi:hypothetical protein [Sinobaca sp. H24]|uniref:hypothetical protein n=1 Tax=Sinobaca sp. H24 TaxID=2923376 RepID=UPI002079D9D2|nr:hypothetical protein [Sinobaca sp. H24]